MTTLPLSGVGCAALLAVLVSSAPSWADDTRRPAPVHLSPQAAVAAALSVHPLLLAAEAELARAQGAHDESAARLGNPQLGMQAALSGRRTEAEASVPISLTMTGQRKRLVASAELAAARSELKRARAVAAAQTRRSYAQAAVSVGKERVAARGLELCADLVKAVQRLSEEGEASTLDLRLARLAEVQAAVALLDAQATAAAGVQDLAGQVGRPVHSGDLDPDPLAAVPRPGAAEGGRRSDVEGLRGRLRAAEARSRLERSAAVPPIDVGLFAGIEDEQAVFGPVLSFELPLFRRNQANRGQAIGQVRAAEGALETLIARAETENSTALLRVRTAETVSAQLTADPGAEAEAALESIQAGYLGGEIDLPGAVLLQAQVLAGQIAAIELRGHSSMARIDLLLTTEDPALVGGAP